MSLIHMIQIFLKPVNPGNMLIIIRPSYLPLEYSCLFDRDMGSDEVEGRGTDHEKLVFVMFLTIKYDNMYCILIIDIIS